MTTSGQKRTLHNSSKSVVVGGGGGFVFFLAKSPLLSFPKATEVGRIVGRFGGDPKGVPPPYHRPPSVQPIDVIFTAAVVNDEERTNEQDEYSFRLRRDDCEGYYDGANAGGVARHCAAGGEGLQ